ncbi:MAG: TonB-dependent receptor plug domain-containing protein [Opitutaceae bacterium]
MSFRSASLGLAGFAASFATAQEMSEPIALPEFVLTDTRVALDEPAAGLPAAVSALRFEPRVDLQTRNFGEAQGDVSIRGGIFEGTAVQLGGATIFDPQTGHYATELPVPAAMLTAPLVMTGAEHAFSGMNATAGTIAYRWKPVEDGGKVSAGFGNGSLNRQSIQAGRVFGAIGETGRRLAMDGEIARSEGDGTIKDGDHDFLRVAGRVELSDETTRTQFFAGHQSKFFGWPNLYTPFGVAETEDIETTLLMLTHRVSRGEQKFESGAWFRRNTDDYEFDRYRPGLFNPYEHETRVAGAFAEMGAPVAGWTATLRGEFSADQIESTSLTAGDFNSRSYWRLAALASRHWVQGAGNDLELRVGGAFDDTNREGSAFSPIASLAWTRPASGDSATLRVYAEASGASRVPGYTALNSPAGGGLFRGNPDLGREKSTNFETGFQLRSANWSAHAALFRRDDDPLVDWTFSASAPNARSAREVATETWGAELVVARAWERVRVAGGYTWLEKDADYFGAPVDASFYALNFARHRFTLSITAELGRGIEVRSDNEWRLQEKNLLRTAGGGDALLSSVGIYWIPPRASEWEFSVVIDNLWKSNFQELPAVPAPGRQVAVGVSRFW